MDSDPKSSTTTAGADATEQSDSCKNLKWAVLGVFILALIVCGVLVTLYFVDRNKSAAPSPAHGRHRRQPNKPLTPSAVSPSTQQAAAALQLQEQMRQYAAASAGKVPPPSNAVQPTPMGAGAAALSDALYKGAPYGAGSSAGVAPMGVAGMGQFASIGNNTSPFNDSYPNNDVGITEASNDPWSGSNLALNKLMPSSWRPSQNQTCGDLKADDSEWAKWSPTKAKFENYVTASGAARMPLTTRNPQSKIIGQSNPLRSQPPVPLSGKSITFNDADGRMSALFQATSIFPSWDAC